jgi:uncharacterized membrane-anchored protein YhcB (DUF1043 family)
MRKIFVAVILPTLLFVFIGLNSCKNRTAENQQKKIELEQINTIDNEIKENVYPLPNSATVIKMLTDFEVGYIFGITNPVENSKKYFTSKSRSINLGAYGADLSYVTLYNIQQEVINYIAVIRSLSNELNISKVYNETFYDSIKINFDNKAELVKILTKAFNDTYTYMRDNDQQSLALLVVGGAWVEGMYLTANVSESAYDAAEFSKSLLDQKKSFELFIELAKPYANDVMISDFLTELDPIKKVYETIGTSLTMDDIKRIKDAIEIVRAKIVS